MLFIQDSFTFVASTRKHLLDDFPLAQFAPGFGVVQAAFNLSAAGVTIDIYSGTTIVSQRLVPLVKSTAPIYPDDYVVTFAVAPGDQIDFDALPDASTPVALWAMKFIPA